MQKQKNKSKNRTREGNRKTSNTEDTDMDSLANQMNFETKTNQGIEISDKLEQNIEKTSFSSMDNIDAHHEQNAELRRENLTVNSINESNNSDNENDVPSEVEICIKSSNSVSNDSNESKNISKPPIDPSIEDIELEDNKKSNFLHGILSNEKKNVPLKYTYSEDQWSPINMNGKKVYGRDFLMKLQNDPNSKIKPSNLPDLEVVLKDMIKVKSSSEHRDQKFKEGNLGRSDSLLPVFAKIPCGSKVVSNMLHLNDLF